LAVWPTDVESILANHEAVLESGVVGVQDKEGLTKPRAYVVLKDKTAASDELVKELERFNRTQDYDILDKICSNRAGVAELPYRV